METINELHECMYSRSYFSVVEVLDEALGTEEKDGAGMGLVSDVHLLAQRYAALKRAVLVADIGPGWAQLIADIEAADLDDLFAASDEAKSEHNL